MSSLNKRLIERFYHTDTEVFHIYQVDGAYVANQMDSSFLNFGYEARFSFIPSNEIWIADTTYVPDTYNTLRTEIFSERELVRRGYIYSTARRILSKVDTEEPTLIDGSNADKLHKHDHGVGEGLGDDDHKHYSLVDGTRPFTGDVTIGDGRAGTNFALKFAGENSNGQVQWDEANDHLLGDDYRQTKNQFDDIIVSLLTAKVGATKTPGFQVFQDDGSGSSGVFAWHFDDASEEQLFFHLHLPHSWREGTVVIPHVHWSVKDASIEDVVWGLEYTWANADQTGGASPNFGATTMITIVGTASGTTRDHLIDTFSGIVATNKLLDSLLICRFFRKPGDAADTHSGDAVAFHIDFHAEHYRIGTNAEFGD